MLFKHIDLMSYLVGYAVGETLGTGSVGASVGESVGAVLGEPVVGAAVSSTELLSLGIVATAIPAPTPPVAILLLFQ